MHLLVTLTSLFIALTHASPILPRAGGPIAKPIPSTCTVTDPIPHTDCSTTNTPGYKPSPAFVSNHTLYEVYFDLPTPIEELWTQCSQQCYGYGDEGDCKSAVLARKVPIPEGYHGAEGGNLVIACLLFDEYLEPEDFVRAVEGQWVDEKLGSIHC